MRRNERIPLHNHVDGNSGGAIDRAQIVSASGSTSGGSTGTTGVTAADVTVADVGAYYTATDLEDVLQELAAKDIGYTAHGAMGATETFSALTGWHSGTFDANCTFTFTDATSGLVASMVLELLENGTGGYSPTWPAAVVWPGGGAPTHTTTAGTTTLYLFETRDGGTTWYGFQTGAGSSLTIKDEGSPLATAATSIDFVGAGVTASGTGAAKTITIPGGTTATDTNIWRPVIDGAGAVIASGTDGALMAYGPA